MVFFRSPSGHSTFNMRKHLWLLGILPSVRPITKYNFVMLKAHVLQLESILLGPIGQAQHTTVISQNQRALCRSSWTKQNSPAERHHPRYYCKIPLPRSFTNLLRTSPTKTSTVLIWSKSARQSPTYTHSKCQDLALVAINLDFHTATALKLLSTSSVSTIGENRLASNPSTIRAEEADDRSNVLDHGKTTPHAICFMKLNGFRRFLGIEERYL